jgi:hypothetical protein
MPEVVGFGVVKGEAKTVLPNTDLPGDFGSFRNLEPFVAWSRPPRNVPFDAVVRHIRALVQLRPDRDREHRAVCDWMARKLRLRAASEMSGKHNTNWLDQAKLTGNGNRLLSGHVAIVRSPENNQLDYEVRKAASVRMAERREARLLKEYETWISAQDRKIEAVRYGVLLCDAYERGRNNLIEAKSSCTREHIRMAVGQILDYSFQGRGKLGTPNLALLLPERPASDLEQWLASISIKLVWAEGGAFVDNANGQFT